MSETFRPWNQEKAPEYNREPGIAVIPGSNYQKEMAKFEQFHSKYTGAEGPGNPYVYRPFPKMVYRADKYEGKVVCMAAPPDPYAFQMHPDPTRAYQNAQEAALRFSEKCQRIVNDEVEYSRAHEDGWRDSPDEAVAHVLSRDQAVSTAAAERNYADRNMSEKARAEIAEALSNADGHLAEIPERPRRRK